MLQTISTALKNILGLNARSEERIKFLKEKLARHEEYANAFKTSAFDLHQQVERYKSTGSADPKLIEGLESNLIMASQISTKLDCKLDGLRAHVRRVSH